MTKTVLVTGVSSGIGQAQAEMLLQQHYIVYGVDKVNQRPFEHPNFHFLQLDITKDLTALFQWLPQVDIICHTAGILDDYSPILETDDEIFKTVFQTNVNSVFTITKFYLPKMIAQKHGIIITMCSIASFLAGGGGISYTMSKHALLGFTKQLALDYADQNIQVFGIAPGAVKTNMTKKDFEPGGLSQWVADETPIKRWIDPKEVAELSLFLASGKARALQGEVIKIDGGWSLK